MSVIVLIPTYNERENIRKLLPRVVASLPNAKILVIDDNSPDGTAEEVVAFQNSIPQLDILKRPGKNGLGQAYMDAFRKVLADPSINTICTMDADLSHSPDSLPMMLKQLEDSDMVIGSRYVPGGKITGWEGWRMMLSTLGNRYCRLVTKLPIKDCTSGFGCIKASALRTIDWSDFDTSGYAFLMYLKYKLWQAGARLSEYPIHFVNRLTGESKISLNIIEEGLLLPWRLIKKSNKTNSIVCPVCLNTATNFWFIKNNCRIHTCSNCEFVFVDPVPTNYHSIYNANYFSGASEGHGYVNYDQEKNSDQSTFFRYLEIIKKYSPKLGKLLDVGAATGAFVAAAKLGGWIAYGVEISDYAARAARQKGLTVVTGTLENAPLPPGPYDVVTLWDVFEHIAKPEPTLTAVQRLLAPGGLAVFNTPNAKSFWARLTGRFWPLLIPPEHIRLYSPKNLAIILKRYNFEVLYVTTIGKRFTLSYIFQVASTVWNSRVLKKIATLLNRRILNKITIPLNLGDNMFVVTRKILP